MSDIVGIYPPSNKYKNIYSITWAVDSNTFLWISLKKTQFWRNVNIGNKAMTIPITVYV